MMNIINKILCLIILGAVSSCSVGCGFVPSAPVTGSYRQPVPADPNQAVLQMMQQKTLERAMEMFEDKAKKREDTVLENKCQPQREMNCTEMLNKYQSQCGVFSVDQYNMG